VIKLILLPEQEQKFSCPVPVPQQIFPQSLQLTWQVCTFRQGYAIG
jgi:hypothetical protein